MKSAKYLVVCLLVSTMVGCGIDQLEEARVEFQTAREQIEEQAVAEERDLTAEELLLIKYAEASEEKVQEVIDKKLAGLSTVGAVADTAVGMLPPPWNLLGGLGIGLLGLGRAAQNKRTAKRLAKAVVEETTNGVLDLT